MANKNVKNLIIAVVVVIGAGVAWFLFSPLLIDETVDEALVIPSTQPEMPSREEVQGMSAAEQQATMQRVMDDIGQQQDQMVKEEMMTEAAPQVLKRGSFRDADAAHRGSGDALVYQLPDGSHLLRFENFKVTNGPDLVVYLAKHPNPTKASQVEEGFLSLGKLKGNVGNQNYIIPPGTDLNEYGSAVIWCELFGVLFSPAGLS